VKTRQPRASRENVGRKKEEKIIFKEHPINLKPVLHSGRFSLVRRGGRWRETSSASTSPPTAESLRSQHLL